MQQQSTSSVVVGLNSFHDVLDGQSVISMLLDEGEYVLVLVRPAAIAEELLKYDLPNYEIEFVTGMAFDYAASVEQSRLVFHPAVGAMGIYAKREDFHKVKDIFMRGKYDY